MREIVLPPDAIVSQVKGVNEVRDRIPVLTRIHVTYDLRIPAGSRETVDRALSRHVDKCPTAQTLKGAVDITWEANVVEA